MFVLCNLYFMLSLFYFWNSPRNQTNYSTKNICPSAGHFHSFKRLTRLARHNVWFSQFWSHFLFASKAKINVFWNFFEWSGPEGASGVKKKFQKTLILAFEVIVQPPKTHFLTFSKVQKTHLWRKKWDQNHENHT